MKKVLILVFVLFGLGALNSQAQINVGATVGAQLPMGNFGDAYNTGFGFNLSGKYMLNDNMAVGLNLGYNAFGSEIEGFKSSMMPITALFEYQFGDGPFKPYVGADLGLYIFGYKIEMTIMGQTIKESGSDMYFGFAPVAGVLYGLSDNLSLNGNLKYNFVMSEGDASTFLGINVGVVYSF